MPRERLRLLHLHLQGKGPQPFALYLSRLTAVFPGRFPTEIMAEMDSLPVGLLEELAEARAYDHAYAIYQQDPKASGGMVDRVKRFDYQQGMEAYGL